MLVRYRGINNKGVLERPWTKWKVLKAISSTLKFQMTVKCRKVDFPMPCKTKFCQSSKEQMRMLRALLPDTPRPHQFQPELRKTNCCEKLDFSRFTNRCLDFEVAITAESTIKELTIPGRWVSKGEISGKGDGPPVAHHCYRLLLT